MSELDEMIREIEVLEGQIEALDSVEDWELIIYLDSECEVVRKKATKLFEK